MTRLDPTAAAWPGAVDCRHFTRVVEELLGRGLSVRFRAHGSSMFPAIRDGEIVTVAPIDRSSIRTGDVVLYRERGGVIAHRVIAIRRNDGGMVEILVRGDALASCDAPIASGRILGRVVAVQSGRNAELRLLRSRRWSRALGWALRRAQAVRTTLTVLPGSR